MVATVRTTPWIGAVDQGTTSTRFIVFDRFGGVVASAQRPVALHTPQPGWVEQDPNELCESVKACIDETCEQIGRTTGADARSCISAVGIANQRETTVAWDAQNGTPLHRALGTALGRACAQRPSLDGHAQRGVAERSQGREQRRAAARDEGSAAGARTVAQDLAHLGPPGVNVLQCGQDAVADGLCARRAARGRLPAPQVWHGRLVAPVGARERSARVMSLEPGGGAPTRHGRHQRAPHEPRRTAGRAVGRAAARVLRDQSRAPAGDPADGGRVWRAGMHATGGRAGDGRAGRPARVPPRPGLHEGGPGEEHVRDGVLPAVQHGRPSDHHGRRADHDDCLSARPLGTPRLCPRGVHLKRRLVDQVDDRAAWAAKVFGGACVATRSSGGVVFVPGLTGLLAPRWEPRVSGAFVGLRIDSDRGHLARAVVDAIAFSNREVIELMQRHLGRDRIQELVVDGGLSRSNVLMQVQADSTDLPIVRPRMTEVTALGSAKAAAIGAGLSDWPAARPEHKDQRDVFYPQGHDTLRTEYDEWRRTVDAVAALCKHRH